MIYHKSEIPADLQRYFVRAEIGLEPTLREFIANMVEVFELCRQLLADDGTLWLNMGDSYAANRSYQVSDNKNPGAIAMGHQSRTRPPEGLKRKDLIGIPWRLAFALQADGWYLRQDIIWHKPNPMPESVTDRCTKAHEYLFLLTKRERYYFDQDAILEPVSLNTHARVSQNVAEQIGSERANGGAKTNGNMNAVWRKPGNTERVRDVGIGGNARPRKAAPNCSGIKNNESFDSALTIMPDKRNKRSVWTIPTESYSEAHFATFPKALVEPCILAGSRPGDIIFDPFLGSGTVAQVAQRLGRHWIGCELNPEYIDLQHDRTRQHGLVLES